MKKAITILLISFVFLGIVSESRAIDMNSTEITKISGTVKVKKTSSPVFKKLKRNLKLSGSLKRLSGGDKVNTRIKSSADMVLKETCVLLVKEQSMFEVPEKLGKDNLQQLKAQQGSLLFKVISGSNFKVQTADVIAGVKGTLFDVEVIDNLNSLFETPNLEIGTPAVGGTVVNVYKGEVTLKHTKTGVVEKLQAGESVAAFGESILNIDKTLRNGFGKIRKFNPVNIARQKYGQAGEQLLKAAPVLGEITNITGLAYPNSIGNMSSRMNNLFSGLEAPVVNKIREVEQATNKIGRIVTSAKEIKSIAQGLLGEKFKPNFSKYRPTTRPFSVRQNRNKEVYLGNQTFMGIVTGFGSKAFKLEPTSEGIAVTDGMGGVRVKKFNGSKVAAEIQIAYSETADQLLTTIKVDKGDLYGRIPGDIKLFKIPRGTNSFVFEKSTGKYSWVRAYDSSIPNKIKNYKFKVDKDFANARKALRRKNSRKRRGAIKKILRRRPRNLLKGFGF